MKEIELNSKNFDETVAAGIVLVDFWATWCGPCRMLAPTIDEIAESRDDIVVGKVNTDEAPELCVRFGIEYIPTLLFFKDGTLVDRCGPATKEEIEARLDKLKEV